jgi:protein-arginine kinase activator protein McsA
LALAVRFGCPIYIYENIFDVAGVTNTEQEELEQKPVTPKSNGNEDLKKLQLEELNALLNDVLEQEDYLRAIAIRDEINSRKK